MFANMQRYRKSCEIPIKQGKWLSTDCFKYKPWISNMPQKNKTSKAFIFNCRIRQHYSIKKQRVQVSFHIFVSGI